MKKTLALILIILSLLGIQGVHSEDTEKADATRIELSEEAMTTLKEYMETELGLRPELVQRLLSKFSENPDIGAEFEQWIINREYNAENPVTVEGYTAKDIAEMAGFMKSVGVYSFLITLREDPEKALGYIKAGFIIK